MLTQEQYQEYKARYDRLEQWRAGRTTYDPKTIPANCVISNAEISAIEVYEFIADPPETYIAYVDPAKSTDPGNGTITTWTGDNLGRITHYGRSYHLFGSHWNRARNIRVEAINGKTYAGTYYESAGDYCRLYQVKS